MLLKNKDGNVEVFYTDDLEVKKLLDAERKKSRALKIMPVREDSKKADLQNRQKAASELRGLKVLKKEVKI